MLLDPGFHRGSKEENRQRCRLLDPGSSPGMTKVVDCLAN